MENLHEINKKSQVFCIWLIRRSNRLYARFGHGRSDTKYIGLVQPHELKAIETVTIATTRFFSSSFKQWQNICANYQQLMQAYVSFREDEHNDCDEKKCEIQINL